MAETCTQCSKVIKSKRGSISTGYGIDNHGNKVCYKCCGKQDKQALIVGTIGDKFLLYVCPNKKGPHQYKVTNWPGSFSIGVNYVSTGHHNIAHYRYDFWFTLSHYNKKHYFWGVKYGDNTDIAHITKVKPY